MGVFERLRALLAPPVSTVTNPPGCTAAGSSPDTSVPRLPLEPELTPIGVVESLCPYCSAALAKRPTRKTKCPACGEPIFVRTRPSDRQKVLLRQDQLEELENQWAIASGTYNEFLADRERWTSTYHELKEELGREPSESEVKWRILDRDQQTHAQDGNWGLYRNTRLHMAQLLEKEGRLRQSLTAYLEVCYLDLNGPSNTGGYRAAVPSARVLAWDPHSGHLAPGVLAAVVLLLRGSAATLAEARALFEAEATSSHQALALPVEPSAAWQEIVKAVPELEDGQSPPLPPPQTR